ncbi:MAG: hypothetical protein UIG59_08200 [Acutalibacteraceae bacterium]|nr:hypothetical protein [Acutalibacteraceae bacterium]
MSPQGVALILLIVICVMALLFSHSNIGQNLIDLMCFLEIPIFMLCGKEISSKNTPKVFLWLQYALSFYYIYLSGTDKAYCFNGKYGVIYLEELTLSYRNPNETAIYLLVCFITLLVAITTYKKLILKLMFAINAGFIFYLVWLTICRAGIVVCVLAVIGLLFLKVFPIKRIITRIALIIPIIMVAVIYLFNDELVEMQFLGSSVDTNRIGVYEQVFSNLQLHEIFLGDFATHSFGNLHNAYISIFGTIGIFGVIIYAYFMYHTLMSHTKSLEYNMSQKMAYIGILLIIIHSAVEAAFFIGGSAYAMGFICLYTLFVFNNQ